VNKDYEKIERTIDIAWEHIGQVSDNIDSSIDVGGFCIQRAINEGKIWIIRQNGEGGEFDIKALEAVIEKFFEENF
jgi:hypothetical protein